ncbi:MAG: hypothetical protein WA400_21270 [Silvibacterium sp.]
MRLLLWFVLIFSAVCAFAQQTTPSATPAGSPETVQQPTGASPSQTGTPPPAPATSSSLPDAPSQSATHPETDASKQQPKRILGVMPNFRAVSPGTTPPPPTFKQSLTIATQNSFDYSSFIFVGITSALAEATDAHPQLGEGMGGFGQYYWRGFVDKTDGNYWVICLLPTALHQDERYYALGEGGFWKRGTYAATRIFVARKYNGDNTFNISEVAGRAIAQGISTTYYPSASNTGEKLAEKYAYALGRDALTNVFREFWPDIATHVLHRHP